MPRVAARNASLYLEDSAGASRSMSGFLNTIALKRSSEAPDVTGFGDDNRQRLSNGIKDWELSFNAFFSTGANEVDQVLSGILGGSTLFKLGPSGSTSTCIMYSACGVLTDYSCDFSIAGAATVTGTVSARSGSLTRGVW